MMFEYNGVKIGFKTFGKKGEKGTLLLHGWGCSGDIFKGVIEAFPERYFIVPDFPPFGESKSLPSSWTVFSYANMVISLCEHLNISQVDILGHSFGGRIAILLSSLGCIDVHSCILVDSAGIKPRPSLKKGFKVLKYKINKGLRRVTHSGSKDYLALPPCMRGVFVNIVNTHLEGYLGKIKAKTLIIWGEKDSETPMYMAKKLIKGIPSSRLEVLNAGHFPFLDCPLSFNKKIGEFWEEL